MSDLELESLATGEALAMADSSKLEGLVLDQDEIRRELLAGYFALREGYNPPNPDPDIGKRKIGFFGPREKSGMKIHTH